MTCPHTHTHTHPTHTPHNNTARGRQVIKELKPKLVATFTEKPGSVEGHPFIVEAAVSIGGSELREGVSVFRFANRIPLLFETGADVVTQVRRACCVRAGDYPLCVLGPSTHVAMVMHVRWRRSASNGVRTTSTKKQTKSGCT